QLFDSLESLLDSLDRSDELTAFRDWRRRSSDPLDELRIEYTRLFINAVPHVTVPPYASVYLDGSGILQGPTTERTRDFYRAHGYDLTSESEPADHLALELDFLAALTGEGQVVAEEVFLRTLFRPWFTRFKERCMQEVRHPFYTVSIQLIDFFTKEEQ
ncbi:MAG: molecular chaperone TorD family protein, partial [Desulfobulbus sp.]|nr:molecular chaperone TorD family protein [Desulfobulbus sp.]